MNTVLVAYASKMGSTREIAEKIGDRLSGAGFDVMVRSCADAPPVGEFSVVIIGSALYLRRWLKEATRYLAREAPDLVGTPTYLFQSGPCSDQPAESVVGAPRVVRRIAATIGASEPVTFGGRLERSTATGPISRWVASGSMAGDYRDWSAISAWADSIAATLRDRRPTPHASPLSPSSVGPPRRGADLTDPRTSGAHGDRGANDPTSRISPLGRSHCERLLAEGDVGRIAWRARSGLQLLPVSYAWHEGGIVFRTSPHGVLAELRDPHDVVFEVDLLDQQSHTGWSIMVSGRAQGVSAAAELVKLWSVEGAVPWVDGGKRDLYIQITPDQITGRSVVRET
jgi:menaquinone-dependent protoporphyrinogen oxidase